MTVSRTRGRLARTASTLALALAAALAIPTAAHAAPPASTTPVAAGRTAGITTPDGRTFIADQSGRALELHGFNAGKNGRVSAADVQEMAAKGQNFLRLVVMWQYIEPKQGQYDQAYLAYINSVLTAADKAGVHVMIDMHQDVYGPAFGSNGIPAWATRTDGLPFQADPDNWFNGYFQPAVMRAFTHLYNDADLQKAQEDLWVTVAKSVQNHQSLLGYDLFNEPFGEFQDGEDYPTASARIEQTDLTPMYNRVIKAIRTVDRTSWMFVEPTVLVGYGVPTQLGKIDDSRVGYAPHFYDTSVEDGADWDPSNGFVENYEAAISLYATENKMPLIVGEWGPPNSRTPGNSALVAAQVASMERFATGWSMWYWCKSDHGGYCAMDAAGNPAPGDEPAFGPYAAATAGIPGSEHYDATTGAYALTYTAGAGSTEIFVPTSVYGSKPVIAVTGGQPHYDATKQLLRITAKPGTAVSVTLGK
ncbi:cellulase family glycosylhydrolase [Microbacterium sp. ASV49]|uniref:Cellulase family glycosylhydrolase n=1 Tax=Microbacterium candidum TaxID=3041922 RepID=A0ABT7N3C6_9MICO|nr:cellulase family glycosylhydrolase [Microbacterium sp. ASV49]MDL9981216.1 cellulase family glycosylhydrolase [Microbacterium sp. ASV49]